MPRLDRAWKALRKAPRARPPGCGLTREPPSYYLRSIWLRQAVLPFQGLEPSPALFEMLRGRIRPGGAVMAHNAESFRWTQPDFLHAITTEPAFDTSFHG